MKRSKDHSNQNSMKSFVCKVALAGTVAVALGTTVADSEAGIWDYCADNAQNCREDAQTAKDHCYEEARANAREEDAADYCTRDEILQDLAEAKSRCDATYNDDLSKCGDAFNDACSG